MCLRCMRTLERDIERQQQLYWFVPLKTLEQFHRHVDTYCIPRHRLQYDLQLQCTGGQIAWVQRLVELLRVINEI